MDFDLIPKYNSRKSFYSKARVKQEEGKLTLFSYNIENGKAFVLGSWGNTTTGHIKEFLKQNGFKAESGNQIYKDYFKQEA